MDSRVEIRDCGIKGRGIFALAPVPAGDIIVEETAVSLMPQRSAPAQDMKTYCFSWDADTIAIPHGPIALTNHAAEANAEVIMGVDRTTARGPWVALRAVRDIGEGEEVTINYSGECQPESEARDMHFEASKPAWQVRAEERLPPYARDPYQDFDRLELAFRRVMAPDIPSYDVNSVQGADFDEWCYTEGMCSLMAFTQSVEVNARLLLEAASEEWPGSSAVVEHLAETLVDKWELAPADSRWAGRKAFFPPGGNLSHLINTDNVLRAFRTDSAWISKPHPVTTDEDVREAKKAFGVTRLAERDSSGMTILRYAEEVGFTTSSEMGLAAMLFSKPARDFTLFARESEGRYHPLYLAVRMSDCGPREVIGRLFACPWSGFVPFTTPIDEARQRFAAYKQRTLELRERLRPLVKR